MKIIKNILLLIILSILLANQANADATFYLLRHAEKQIDGTKDPHLTEQGHLRASFFAQQLSLAKITKIYSTNYHRTHETVKPLSDLLNISVDSYDPRKLEEFARSLKEQTGQIIIVGHSNTTPQLTALLSGEVVDDINDDEYTNLYQIVLIGDKTRLNRLQIFPIED